jgi:hypothetical protein
MTRMTSNASHSSSLDASSREQTSMRPSPSTSPRQIKESVTATRISIQSMLQGNQPVSQLGQQLPKKASEKVLNMERVKQKIRERSTPPMTSQSRSPVVRHGGIANDTSNMHYDREGISVTSKIVNQNKGNKGCMSLSKLVCLNTSKKVGGKSNRVAPHWDDDESINLERG